VRLLERLRLPKAIAAALVVIFTIGALVGVASYLAEPAAEWAERLPQSVRQMERKLRPVRQPLEEVVAATDQVEQMTEMPSSAQKVQVKSVSLAESLLTQTRAIVTLVVTVVVLLYFLLASGDAFISKLIRTSSRLADKRAASQIIRRTESEISRYLLTISIINTTLGLITWMVLLLLGLPNAALWGASAALLNFVPFVGGVVNCGILFAVGVFHFDHVSQAFAAPLLFGALSATEGLLVTPAILGQRLALSPVAVFVSLMIWSWLWGIPGAIIAVPTTAALKLVCDQVPSLRLIGAILGR